MIKTLWQSEWTSTTWSLHLEAGYTSSCGSYGDMRPPSAAVDSPRALWPAIAPHCSLSYPALCPVTSLLTDYKLHSSVPYTGFNLKGGGCFSGFGGMEYLPRGRGVWGPSPRELKKWFISRSISNHSWAHKSDLLYSLYYGRNINFNKEYTHTSHFSSPLLTEWHPDTPVR